MTVAQLRAELKNRGLDTTGLKADLAARLQAARGSAGNSAHADGSLKRKRDPTTAAVVPTTVRYLQRGAISILDAVAEEIPDVFTEHILPNLDMEDTLSLAQVNKAYNDAVWSVDGVRSLEKKIEAHIEHLTDMLNKEGRDYEGETYTLPMYWAIDSGNLPAVRALLESGVDVNEIINTDEDRALHHAAMKPNPKVVKALIEAGADVNVRDCEDDTALGLAITTRALVPNVIELIKAGADVNLANCLGDTPLHLAVATELETSVALLIQAGADVHKVDHKGISPMELAVRRLASWKEDGHTTREAKRRRRKDDKKFREFLSLSNRYYYLDGLATHASKYENILSLMRYAGAK
jgi:hypothetical protein